MWLVEADGQQPGRVAGALQLANRFGGHLAIRLIFVVSLGRQPPAPTAISAGIGQVASLALLAFFRCAENVRFGPTSFAVVLRGQFAPGMKDLADADRTITAGAKQLRKRHDVAEAIPKVNLVREYLRGFRTQAGEERRAAGIADRVLTIGPLESQAACRQPIDVRRVDMRAAVAAEFRPQVVSDDD